MILIFFVNSVGFFKFVKGCAANDGVAEVFRSLFTPVVSHALFHL